jgi:antagonist of KipI
VKGSIEVLKPGLMTTVQDLGRFGYQGYGMPVAGAMDSLALQIGNLLVGNARHEAALEVTMAGPRLRFQSDTVIAITGAHLHPTVDGNPVTCWKSMRIQQGQVLDFGQPVEGLRAYVAIAGGIAVQPVMGSKSTYLKARVGGFHGRPLKRGDCLPIGTPRRSLDDLSGRWLSREECPRYPRQKKVRVVLGPQKDAFTEEGLRTFLTEVYEVTPQSDRMGYRLRGPKIQHRESADIISDAVAPGAIQVPADGQPIILMADRQTVGGYTIIGTVISVDLPWVAQAAPGTRLLFEAVSVDQAQALAVEREKLLRQLELAGA